MSAQQNAGFGQFIPGFDFLQNLAKEASSAMPRMPNLSNWVAPTLNLEELEKRIGELKAVQFWLEQNRTALAATIQALEVQKMTLATLKGMNMNMADIADAMTLKPGAAAGAAPDRSAAKPKAGQAAQAKGEGQGEDTKVVDPLQWWGALTQQFQQIAATAMQEVAASSADGSAKAKTGNGQARASAPAAPAAGAAKRAAKGKRPARKAAPG
jgi:hypothetical protein